MSSLHSSVITEGFLEEEEEEEEVKRQRGRRRSWRKRRDRRDLLAVRIKDATLGKKRRWDEAFRKRSQIKATGKFPCKDWKGVGGWGGGGQLGGPRLARLGVAWNWWKTPLGRRSASESCRWGFSKKMPLLSAWRAETEPKPEAPIGLSGSAGSQRPISCSFWWWRVPPSRGTTAWGFDLTVVIKWVHSLMVRSRKPSFESLWCVLGCSRRTQRGCHRHIRSCNSPDQWVHIFNKCLGVTAFSIKKKKKQV